MHNLSEVNIEEYPELTEVYENALVFLDEFFGLEKKINPRVFLVPDRKTINEIRQEETEDWIVAWSNGKDVWMLAPENLEKESSHIYSDETYSACLVHEIVHCYVGEMTRYRKRRVPFWLSEGIAIDLSGQNEFKTKPQKLHDFINYCFNRGREMYYESGFAVEFLRKKYDDRKLLDLLTGNKDIDTSESFARFFESVYGFELKYENFEVLNEN